MGRFTTPIADSSAIDWCYVSPVYLFTCIIGSPYLNPPISNSIPLNEGNNCINESNYAFPFSPW